MGHRPPYSLLGHSGAIVQVVNEARFVSGAGVNVLLTGERGVGKGLLAQCIHEHSPRRRRKMLSRNCEGVPQLRLETDLFGRTGGGITATQDGGMFERAHGSSLLLDEVGALSGRMQSLLLGFLVSREVPSAWPDRGNEKIDVRIISASSRDLLERRSEQAFSADLFYRLNVAHVQVPPLRERREDISSLMRAYLAILSEHFRLPRCEVAACAMSALEAYNWPDNVRELREVAQRLALTHAGRVVTADQLPDTILAQGTAMNPAESSATGSAAEPAAAECYAQMTRGRGSFWTVVYEPFLEGKLTRDAVRGVIGLGLRHTSGNYKRLTALFNLGPADHQRLLIFLLEHNCYPRTRTSRMALEDTARVSSRRRNAV